MIPFDHIRERLGQLIAFALVCFVLFTSAFGELTSLIQRPVFLLLVILLGTLHFPLWRKSRLRPLGRLIDLAMAAMALVACGYIIAKSDDIMTGLPMAQTLDLVLCWGLVVLLLELARRTVGWIFPLMVVLMLAYTLLGADLPEPLRHRGFDIYFVTETLFLGDLGLWGMLLGVAATVIAAFTVFGSLLLQSGGGQALLNLSLRVGGRSRGGAAKIATIASGLFGMVSGSSVANVATTGNFTIPMMRRLGYPPALAGGVEAVASTGSQLAPPIMGAAAFIMAELIDKPYTEIALGAVLPALLFYGAIFLTIHFLAIRLRLDPVPESELPSWRQALNPTYLLPVVAAFAGLLFGIVSGNSIQTTAFYAICGVVIGFVGVRLPIGSRAKPETESVAVILAAIATDVAKGLVVVGVLLACAQILVAMINLTGVGVAMASGILALAGDSALSVAIIVALVCMIMGMGVPTTAAYVLVASVMAPALTNMGFEPYAAHMFVFFYATLSVITPPVCIAVFVAAGIAGERWIRVARWALTLSAVTYLIPFLFLFSPGYLGQGGAMAIINAVIFGGVICVAVSVLLSGLVARNVPALLTWLVVAVCAAWPSLYVQAGALALLGPAVWLLRRHLRVQDLPVAAQPSRVL
ncbi:TRAP transporter permease [Marinobacterium rhizophilum]|uniref:TRAP transporter permease n=1 Tax=Marinobacterium rhizophilum TaxID=420402 RepID=UPI00037C33AE|nr:TRAP transporter fused permease subunit [Marinobacterium rhizophilum]